MMRRVTPANVGLARVCERATCTCDPGTLTKKERLVVYATSARSCWCMMRPERIADRMVVRAPGVSEDPR